MAAFFSTAQELKRPAVGLPGHCHQRFSGRKAKRILGAENGCVAIGIQQVYLNRVVKKLN